MADIFFKFAPLYEFPRPDKEHKRAIRLFQQGVYPELLIMYEYKNS